MDKTGVLESTELSSQSLTLVSSINGGFSRGDGNEICTLQDLLRVIQPLGLRLFDGKHFTGRVRIGEGVTYRVSRYTEKESDGGVYAVKQVKLPKDGLQREEFQRKVRCVLKEVEVMHHPPLENHKNILTLYGYGWGLPDESSLPFLVTELSSQGNLREFLHSAASKLRMLEKYQLCCDVASGIHAIHSCGVTHGDLKLENVLVFEDKGKSYIAKLSDFGHACVLSPEQAKGTPQTYHGTVGYLPPELALESVDLRKCDSWTLGLLTWEVLLDGKSYLKTDRVQSFVSEQESTTRKSSQKLPNAAYEAKVKEAIQSSDSSTLGSQILSLALEFAEAELTQNLEYIERNCVKAIFRKTLPSDPALRQSDISKLPFIYSDFGSEAGKRLSNTPLKRLADPQTWTYEDFKPQNSSLIPHGVKVTIVADAKRAALQSGLASAKKSKAALYVAQAYANGYGVEKSVPEFLSWTATGAEHGSKIATLLLDIVSNRQHATTVLLRALRETWEQSAASEYVKNTTYCRCQAKEAENWDLASFISVDGLNGLHYLALFEDLAETLEPLEHQSCTARFFRYWERKSSNSPSKLPELAATRKISSSSSSGQHSNSSTKFKHLENQDGQFEHAEPPTIDQLTKYPSPQSEKCLVCYERSMREIFCQIILSSPETLNTKASKIELLDPQFPIQLRGSPLSFAILLKAQKSVIKLLNLGSLVISDADIYDPEARDSNDDDFPLQVAISSHLPDTLSLFWSHALQRYGKLKLHTFFLKDRERGARLICAISQRTSLERLLLNGPSSQNACLQTLRSLLNCLRGLYSRENGEEDSQQEFASVLNKALEKIVALGDLDVAKELVQEIGYEKLDATWSRAARQSVVDTAIRMGSGNAFGLVESEQFFNFAVALGSDLGAQLQILRTLIMRQNVQLFRRQLQRGINWNDRDDSGRSVLHFVIEHNFNAHVSINELTARGARANLLDSEKCSPLHLAARKGLSSVFLDLLQTIPDISALESQFCPIIHCAVESGTPRAVEAILEALSKRGLLDAGNGSIRMSQRDLRYQTALHIAAEKSYSEIADLLIRYGASVKETDLNQNTALHLAVTGATTGNILDTTACCNLLLKAGCSAGALNRDGNAAIHLAPQNHTGQGLHQMLRLFAIDSSGGIDLPDLNGRTILFHAAAAGKLEVVQMCRELNASAQSVDLENSTPLHACAKASSMDSKTSTRGRSRALRSIADSLLIGGADTFAQNCEGLFATDYAAANGSTSLFCRLLQHAESLAPPTRKTKSPLSQLLASAWRKAINGQHWSIVRELLCGTAEFDKDLSLMGWPVGARFLRYAIQTNDLAALAHFKPNEVKFPMHSPTSALFSTLTRDSKQARASHFSICPFRFQVAKKPVEEQQHEEATVLVQFSGRIFAKDFNQSWIPDEMESFEHLAAGLFDSHVERNGLTEGSPLRAINSFAHTWETEIIERYFHRDYGSLATEYFGRSLLPQAQQKKLARVGM